MTEELWTWSATRTAQAIRDKEISATEAVTAALSRVTATQEALNAFGEVTAEEALAAAKEADDAVARGDRLGPLHGVPTAFKLNTPLAGRPTPDGVAAYLDRPAAETAPALTRLLDAGAIPVGRTNCPPFSTRWTTESEHFGVTRNPWDPAVTSGGSSGGAAVAVATGAVPLAHGNDIAGSIRYPAASCGVVGIRPTVGRVPLWHAPPGRGVPLAVQQFGVEGPLARTVEDLRLGLSVMEGADPRDPVAVPVRHLSPRAAGGPVRVALVTEPGSHPLAARGTPATSEAVRTAGDWLADAGYEVEEVTLPALGEAAGLWWRLALTEFRIGGLVAEVHRVGDAGIRRFYDLMCQIVDDAVGEVSFAGYLAAHEHRALVRRQVAEFMARFPVLLLPASGEPPFPLGADLESADRARELMRHQWPNTAVPVLGLPGLGIGTTPTGGAPLGVQLVGRAFEEERLFEAGAVIQRRAGLTVPVEPRG